jgi:hypothetical protein
VGVISFHPAGLPPERNVAAATMSTGTTTLASPKIPPLSSIRLSIVSPMAATIIDSASPIRTNRPAERADC